MIEVLDRVQYKRGWALVTGCDHTSPPRRPYLRWSFYAPCADTGEEKLQQGRTWYLSAHMTAGELVQTAFAAALQAEEHECREFFTFQGLRIFGPHLSLEALVSRAHMIERREG